MSESIKIVGEWRTMERLTPGVWLSRLRGLPDTMGALSISHKFSASPGCEYFGLLEIIESEPTPTPTPMPLPGCRCGLTSLHGGSVHCKSVNWLVAAVKAIVAMEGK